MADAPPQHPSFLYSNRTSNFEVDNASTKISSSSIVTNAIQKNNYSKMMKKISRDIEEYKGTMWKKFVENERKKRIFDSSNPRDTIPSHYLKTLEEADIVRKKFKQCIMLSGARSASAIFDESSLSGYELKPSKSYIDLTRLQNVKNPARTDLSFDSFATISSLKIDNQDGSSQRETDLKNKTTATDTEQCSSEYSQVSYVTMESSLDPEEGEAETQEETRMRLPNEYRESPSTSTGKPSKGRKTSKRKSPKKMETKHKDNEDFDEQEIKQNEIIIVGHFQNDDQPEERKVTFDLGSNQGNESEATILYDDGASTSRKVPEPEKTGNTERKTILKNCSVNLTAVSESGLRDDSELSAKRYTSEYERVSSSTATLGDLDIPEPKPTRSLLKRFLKKLSDTDKRSPIVQKYVKDELARSGAEESSSRKLSSKKDSQKETCGCLKKAWSRAKRYTMLGLAANVQERTDEYTEENPPGMDLDKNQQ